MNFSVPEPALERFCRGCLSAALFLAIAAELFFLFSYTNNELSEVSSWILVIASARSCATESTVSFLHSCCLLSRAIVFVVISSSSDDSFMRFIAGPESTACEQAALRHPRQNRSRAGSGTKKSM